MPAANPTRVEAEARAAIETYTVELDVTWPEGHLPLDVDGRLYQQSSWTRKRGRVEGER